MGIAKCRKCNTGFRASKAKESLCAPCEVKYQPLPSSLKQNEEDFGQMAGEIYGEVHAVDFQLSDMFNHRQRLNDLSSKLEDISDSKERVRQKREIGRLLEEHDAVQMKLADMKNMFIQKLMFPLTTSPIKSYPPTLGSNISTASFSSPKKQDDINNNMNASKTDGPGLVKMSPTTGQVSPEPSQKIEEKILLASPVKQTLAFFEMAAKRSSTTADDSPKKSQKIPPIHVQNVQRNSAALDIVQEAASLNPAPTLNLEEVDKNDDEMSEKEMIVDDSEDEPTPQLARSNSVRNRIKAFEEISRRASTGSWDRKPNPKRTLQF